MKYPALSVCSLWRHCTLSTHIIWNTIYISKFHGFLDEIGHASLLASRSGLKQPLELHLHVDCSKVNRDELCILSERLGEFLPRIEHLFLQIRKSDYHSDQFPLPINLPSLRTLRVSTRDGRRPEVVAFERIFGHPTPALETMAVAVNSITNSNLFSALPFSTIPSIRHLDVINSEMTNDKVFEIIAALPNLEVLAWDPWTESAEFHPRSPPVHLPNLRSAFLYNGPHAEVLSSITAPRLGALHLVRGSWKSQSALALGTVLGTGQHFPTMVKLTVEDMSSDNVSMLDVLALPALVDLRCEVNGDVECAELFQGLQSGRRPLQALRLYLTLFNADKEQASFVSAEVLISHLSRYMEWRRASPNPVSALSSISFNISDGEIPFLRSLCDSFQDSSLKFVFSRHTSDVEVQATYRSWWRSNTPKGSPAA